MGIFDKIKAPAPKEEPIIEQCAKQEFIETSLTDKMLRVDLDGDKAYIRHPEIKENGDNIRIVSDGIIIAEIGRRGKARKELEPHIGRRAESATVRAKSGDYGDYYRLQLKFITNTAKITIQ